MKKKHSKKSKDVALVATVTWKEADKPPEPQAPPAEEYKSISLDANGRSVSVRGNPSSGGVILKFKTMQGAANIVTVLHISAEAAQALVDLLALRGVKYGTFVKTDDIQVFEARTSIWNAAPSSGQSDKVVVK